MRERERKRGRQREREREREGKSYIKLGRRENPDMMKERVRKGQGERKICVKIEKDMGRESSDRIIERVRKGQGERMRYIKREGHCRESSDRI